MNNVIYFIAFFIFLLCEYAIIMVSNYIAQLSNATGNYYWSIVIVLFLLLNEFVFGSYDFAINFNDDEEDDEYEWLGDENN